jgi:hypothetical protein
VEGHNKIAVANLQTNLSDVNLAHRETPGDVRCSIAHGHYVIISLGIETLYVLHAGRPGQDCTSVDASRMPCKSSSQTLIVASLDPVKIRTGCASTTATARTCRTQRELVRGLVRAVLRCGQRFGQTGLVAVAHIISVPLQHASKLEWGNALVVDAHSKGRGARCEQ